MPNVFKNSNLNLLENVFSKLQCIVVARRTLYTPELVTWSQYDILDFLRLNGPKQPSFLAKQLGVTSSTLSKALRVLKDLNFIQQTQIEGDRREQLTRLTDLGLQFLNQAENNRHNATKLIAQALTAGEQAIFTELCAKINNALALDKSEIAGK